MESIFFTIYFIIYLFYCIFCYLLKTNPTEIVCHICRPLVPVNIGGPCSLSTNVCVRVRVCVCACVRACMRVCVRAQSYLTLCNPMDCSTPGSSAHGIFQARIPDWVAVSFSRGSSQPRDQIHISCVPCIIRQILYHCATWEGP